MVQAVATGIVTRLVSMALTIVGRIFGTVFRLGAGSVNLPRMDEKSDNDRRPGPPPTALGVAEKSTTRCPDIGALARAPLAAGEAHPQRSGVLRNGEPYLAAIVE